MSRFLFCLLPVAALFLIVEKSPAQEASHLTITTNALPGRGLVYLTIFKSKEGFPDNPQAALHTLKIPLKNGVAHATAWLPKGRYAIGAFYDKDGNGALTKNIFGVPAEPYGFSNGVRGRFRAPYFSEAAFPISGAQEQVVLELR